MKVIRIMSLLILALGMTSVASAKEKKKKTKYEPGMYAEITTDKGTIVLQLEYEKTPMTVANFVGLAEGKFTFRDTLKFDKPFYDGLKFHRVIKDFMIQGGDPSGNGSGGPGYKFYDEFNDSLKHTGPGILSMANSGPATNGSQFFITHKETSWLDGKHTVFGHVITGQDVVDAITQDDVMTSVKIIRVGRTAKKWKATEVFNQTFEKIEAEYMEKAARIEMISKMSEEEYKTYMFEQVKEKFPNAQQSESGLVYVIENEGESVKATKGSKMSVHYKGTFRADGKKFDSSYDRGQPMEFQYQVQRMIPGFEEGLGMIGKGGKAKLIIPYYQAYGPNGRPGAIPPYSDLVFDVEVMDLTPAGAEMRERNHGHDHDHDHEGHDHNHQH